MVQNYMSLSFRGTDTCMFGYIRYSTHVGIQHMYVCERSIYKCA